MYGSDPEALVAFWRGHDRCDSVPSVIDTLPHVSTDSLHVVHYVYPHGAYGSDVEFYKILKGQHQWLGPTGEDINYTVAIWDFFNRYKWLPQTAAGISVVSPVDVRIFPNPASAELHISLEGSSGRDMQVSIMDIMGRAVYATVGTGDIQINTANFAKGVYTVAVIADGQKITKKICLAD